MLQRLLLILLLSLWVTPASAAHVAGKVAVAGDGIAGVRVVAYPLATLSLVAEPSFVSALSSESGEFILDLPPGQYYLLARSGEWFSYYGRNPVTVPADGLTEVNLPLVATTTPVPQLAPAIDNGIAGQVLQDGKPVANAVVFAYPDLSAQLKGFGLGMSAPTGADGVFELPLSAGSYYLVARVRHGNSLAGPLTAGDLFGYLPQNPVTVGTAVSRVALPVVALPEKVARHAATMFGQTRITGTVVDRDGTPLAGLQALLYTDESMLNRPLYVSAPTTADGVFHLSFPTGGTYYLAARNSLGGTPAPGELYGRYQAQDRATLTIDTGSSIDGIRIVVEDVW
jgi:hypothetical protein